MKLTALSLGLILSLAGLRAAHAQGTPPLGPKDGPTDPPTDLDRVKVGERAPDFTLEALDGRRLTLSGYRGQRNVVDEEKRTTELLALSIDSKSDLQKMVDRISQEDGKLPDFSFLSDPGHRVINRYGLLNPNDPRGR